MKKFITLWIAAFAALSYLSAGTVISYTATEKLPIATSSSSGGLHIDGFNTSISNHFFLEDRGFGFICFSDEVTSIKISAFSGCTGLTSITIPNSVTSIGVGAFSGCTSLTEIIVDDENTVYDSRNKCNAIIETATNTLIAGCKTTVIPNSVTSIEDWAFYQCSSLVSITIPNSVTGIGRSAFEGCTNLEKVNYTGDVKGWLSIGMGSNPIYYSKNLYINDVPLTDLVIPDGVTDIGYTFAYDTCLTSVTIPNSVTVIKNNAFYGCTNLEKVNYTGDVKGWLSIDMVSNPIYYSRNLYLNDILLTDLVIPEGVTEISTAFAYDTCLTSVSIPYGITNLEKSAFYGCTKIDSVTINSEAIIENYTLKGIFGEQISKCVLGDSITSIDSRYFYNCTNLTSVTIPNVTSIYDRAFTGCTNLTSVTIDSDTIIRAGYDENYSIKSIFGEQVTEYIIGNSVKGIGDYALYGCTGLTSVTIPNSVTSIGDSAFYGCESLKKVNYIGDAKGWLNMDMWDTPIYYSRNLYINDVLLTDLVIPDGVTEISTAFVYDTCLTSVTIPNSVTSIGDYTFYKCNGLTSVTIGNSVTSIGESAFEGCTGLTSITIPNSVTSIGKMAFFGCTGLTSVTIGNSVTSIGESAFEGCTGLTSVTIGNSVTSIGDEAFYGCTGLASVTIPNSVTSIGYETFKGCTGLASVTIGNSVTSIGDEAFCGCTGLTSVTIPNSVTSIGESAFCGCTGLASVTIPNSVTSIGDVAFAGCTDLTSVTIPNSVTSIGESAFAYCTSLTSVTIGNSVTSIGNYAFGSCTGLHSVTIGKSVTHIRVGAFFDCESLASVTSRAITPPEITWSNQDFRPRIIYIPCGTKEAYQSVWGTYHYIEIPNSTLDVTSQNEDMGSVVITQQPSCNDNKGVFKAVANKGYHFMQWNDGNTANPRTVTIVQDTAFVAEFALGSEYTITATCNSQQGKVFGSGVYVEGTQVTLTAAANRHYHFTQWTDGNTDNPRKIMVERNATYTAEFAVDQHTITAICNPQQGVVTGAGTYDYGTQVTLTATANEGYGFTQWSNGITDNPYIFTAIKDVTLEAQFISTTAVDEVLVEDSTAPKKIVRNGQVYILRNGKIYTIQGQEIKE